MSGVVVVTGLLVSPVIPPKPRVDSHGRRPGGNASVGVGRRVLSLPSLPATRARSAVYGFAAIDDRGRIAARHVIRSLDWYPGIPLDVQVAGGPVLITPASGDRCRISRQGHLRMPIAVRVWCGLVPGSRVLLAAEPVEGRLVVCPPAALHSMLAWACAIRAGALARAARGAHRPLPRRGRVGSLRRHRRVAAANRRRCHRGRRRPGRPSYFW
jgi:hypothetical protein